MPAPAIAASAEQIDADWMTAALQAGGVLPEGRVTAISAKPVGNGLVGDSFRFSLTYDAPPPGAPASVVGKFAAADPVSRGTGAAMGLYLREVSFYRELAHTVGIITPKAYYAGIDPATSDFTLIFEDFGPARQGDQLTGCSLQDARTALLEAAALHAPRWGDASLEQASWLTAGEATMPAVVAALPGVIQGFRERYEGQLEPELFALIDRMPAAIAALQQDRSTPRTVQHGDFRLDNILFDIQGGSRRMGTLDWQTLALGAGVSDAAYFLSAGISPELRREHDRDLIGLYHAELVRLGVRDYDFERCWNDYRRYSLNGMLLGVFSAMVVERTERGDALFLAMTRGGCLQALDNGTFDFWGA
ncbi:hypothetical protein QO010_002076 [Caulobacter ginsengisoli]|uniref:CHK kinase-like domain-containing protein n=1 Tax=Caulobacter ginsengisoli TaxID=400775 RepID=A0ABU0IS99_9CAUL|nr:phosphotransferase [Caulobacter ginsengisoli]MDQ0464295.1 hypothetical protein [Caulobacter ginsengisoli]